MKATFRNYKTGKNYSAFTLVELLVVISIIALLLSILMPALNRVREQAKSVMCKTNLRTIGQAEMLYAQENKEQLVLIRFDRPNNSGYYWAAQLWAVYNGIKAIPTANQYSTHPPIKRPKWLVCPSLTKFNDTRYSAGVMSNLMYRQNTRFGYKILAMPAMPLVRATISQVRA